MADPHTGSTPESGTTINEHYSICEYVNRRAGFLGTLPDFAHMLSGLLPMVRRDALEVFKSDLELSVQEVRRRELASEVDPLLPLPTTHNTETLDDYRSYPAREWRSGDRWPASQVLPTEDNLSAHSAEDPWAATSPDAPAHDQSQVSRQADALHQSQVHAAGPGSERTQTAPMQSANMPQTIQSSPSRTSQHRSSDQSTTLHQPSSSPTAAAVSTQATTPMSAPMPEHAPVSNANMSQAELLRRISDRLGQPLPKSTAAKNVHVANDVSALAGRGMHVPVKGVKRTRGTKRAAVESPEATDSVVGSDAGEPTKRARLTLKGPRETSLSPAKEAGAPSASSRAKAKKPRSAAKKATAVTQPRKSKKPAAPQSAAPDNIEAVIAGTRLPASKAQATQAAELRHSRLLAQHNAASPPNPTGDEAPPPDPDCPPEFFNPTNFAAGEEEDSVRCVCGVRVDDGAVMVGCEACRVWQHTACMGGAVPMDLRRSTYLCQVCAPWAHRKLIAGLRLGQPVGAFGSAPGWGDQARNAGIWARYEGCRRSGDTQEMRLALADLTIQ
ncbi:hypothetical protein LTR53_005887 [Teratosphaeriaceae sp. CCFEE 6253]|nr:hypothetical protein LTR53_005887 [Teratosphaeriaceae sp. CCFEE 6253]